jgi:hypothetical protein
MRSADPHHPLESDASPVSISPIAPLRRCKAEARIAPGSAKKDNASMSKAPGDIELLPELYAGWIDALLGGLIPRERRATCNACAMCRPDGGPARSDERYFDPTAKCCTYTPGLPNFLVGQILADGDPAMAEGRASVKCRIEARLAVTPLELGLPPGYARLYDNASEAFGRSRALRCPHYVEAEGRCGIWRHREAVCATWFCKHVRGEVGYAFWRDALLRLLSAVEEALAKWCVLELDIGADALARLSRAPAWTRRPEPLTAAALDLEADEAAHGRIWGNWRGREDEFYRLCGERVRSLDWDEVLALAGPEGRALALLTRRAYERLTSDTLAEALVTGEMQISGMGPETTRVVTYSENDPLDIPNLVLALLPTFDGRPTAEAVAAIAERTGITLGADLLRKLADFGVLKPPTR